jgi:hypothetical protein
MGGSISMFFREPSFDSLPKGASAGDIFSGTVTYIRANKAVVGNGTRPGGFPIRYCFADVKPPAAAPATTVSTSTPTPAQASVAAQATNKAVAVTLVGGGGGGGGSGGEETPVSSSPSEPATSTADVASSVRDALPSSPPPVISEGDAGLEAAVKEAKIKYLKGLASSSSSSKGSKDAFISLYARINAGV